MNDSSHDRIRASAGFPIKPQQVLAAAVLGIFFYHVITSYQQYYRETRIAQDILSLGGVVRFQRQSSDSLPELWPSDRIWYVSMVMTKITRKNIADLGTLQELECLSLTSSDTTDADLNHLTNLRNLRDLYLNYTKTTATGRAQLRKALPNCRIHPDP
jgi:hypothetical protein